MTQTLTLPDLAPARGPASRSAWSSAGTTATAFADEVDAALRTTPQDRLGSQVAPASDPAPAPSQAWPASPAAPTLTPAAAPTSITPPSATPPVKAPVTAPTRPSRSRP